MVAALVCLPGERLANGEGSGSMRCVLSLLAVVLLAATRANVFTAPYTATPPPLRASLSGAVWRAALKATAFTNFTDFRAATNTRAYLLYDSRNLYVAFRCQQGGTPITAVQRTNNAGVASDDHVTLWLDTSGNGSRVYSFSVNPRGVRNESSSENARYAPSWQSFAAIRPDGSYTVLMVIPLSILRAQGAAVQTWRVNFERYVAARNVDYTWAYQPSQPSVTDPLYWPRLKLRTSATATRPRPQADLYVLQSAGSQRDEFQNGISNFQPHNPRIAGLDVTYPFTNTLALVGTVNPDFSNVEEDQTTIAPQEFQRAYNEYRPFFSQGAQYIAALPQVTLFGGGNSMFYTPSIGIFDWGAKVEGTAGRNAIGALHVDGPGVQDTAFGYDYAPPNDSFSISTQGVLAHHDGVDDSTLGFGLTQLNPRTGIGTQLVLAGESGTLVGNAGTAQSETIGESWNNQHWHAQLLYTDVGPEYHPLDGYTAVSDIRGPGALLRYSGAGTGRGPVQSYSLTLFGDRYLDRSGMVHQADLNMFYSVNFRDLISISGFAGPSELRFYRQPYPAYTGGQTYWFNRRSITVAYAANSPSPLSIGYAWGPFDGNFVQQLTNSATRAFGRYSISLLYDANLIRAQSGGAILNSQWLRGAALTESFGRSAAIALAWRSINGTGGFAQPGTNLSLLYQQRFRNQDMLYLEYGTPAAPATLHRFIVKFVFHAGGATGS